MADLARLGIRFETEGAEKAERAMDGVANASERVEAATTNASTATKRSSSVMAGAANDARGYASATERLAAEQEAAIKTANRLNAAHGSAVSSSKSLQYATLNLGRQFSDVGVSLASGMNPLMVLVQQGPQIGEIFATLKTEGIGAGAAFRSMGAALAPALPLIIGIGAAIGVVVGAFGLFERAVDKQTKNATTFGDTWKAVLKVTGDYIMDGPIGDGLKWLEKAFSKTLDFVTAVVAGGAIKIAGFFGASYLAIVNNWKRLPEVVGVILQNAANAAIKATEWLINKGIDGINALGKNFGFAQIGKVALGTFKSASIDIAKQFDADQKRIEAETEKGLKDFMGKVAAQADREFEKRQKATKAVREHTKAIELQNETVAASNEVWPEALAIAAAYEAQQKALKTAANDNIKTFQDLGVAIPSAMENAATELERIAAQSRDVAWGVEDIADAINRNDWTSAFASLARVLSQVQSAFKAGADSATKFAAAAGLAQGIGAVVGGSTGSAISATASGALTGFQLGGPVGAVIGGGLGLVSSLFGSSKAKKQQKAQEAAQRAAEEAARQQQISDTTFSINVALLEAQGKAEEALAMTRQRELDALAKLDPSLVALQQQLYAAKDQMDAAAKEAEAQAQALQKEIAVRQTQRGIMLQLMALDDAVTGGNSAVVAARRDELAALDPVSRALKEIYFARLDEGEALAKQAAAAQEAAEAAFEMARAYQETNIGLVRQLMALDDAVTGGTSARDAMRADELAKLDATGKALQTIIWARQDEADLIAKQAAEAAKAAEMQAAAQAEALAASEKAQQGYLAYLTTVEDAAQSAAEAQAQAARSLADGFGGVINKMNDLSNSLKEFADTLAFGELSGLSGNEAYRATRSRLLGASGEQTQDAVRAFLAASREVSATDQDYRLDVAFARSIANQRAVEASGAAQSIAALFSRAFGGQAVGFATGGSFEVGGSGPADSKLFNLALSPGEMVNVQRPGSANDNSEMAALRQEVRELRQVIASGLVKVADNVNETNDFLRNGIVTTVGA